MPVHSNRSEVESSASVDPASCSTTTTTTDTVSILSPSAAATEDNTSGYQQFSEDPAASSRFIRRRIDSFIRNIGNAPVVGAAFDYVKDVNDRSTLVRSFSARFQPILVLASPVITSLVEHLDTGLDTTCRIVDVCAMKGARAIPVAIATGREAQQFAANTVTARFELAKSDVQRNLTVLWDVSQDVVRDISRKKEVLLEEVHRRRTSLLKKLAYLPKQPTIQMLLGLPVVCYDRVFIVIKSQFQQALLRVDVVVSQIAACKELCAAKCRSLQQVDAGCRGAILRDFVAQQYERMSLRWEVLQEEVVVFREKVSNQTLEMKSKVWCVADNSLRKLKNLMLIVPEENRMTALAVNTKVFAKLRIYLGDKKIDYVLDGLRSALQVS